ncbi:hypothetical protein [Actinocorallia aurea]
MTDRSAGCRRIHGQTLVPAHREEPRADLGEPSSHDVESAVLQRGVAAPLARP